MLQNVTGAFAKGGLSGCKRWLFSARFVAFYNAKGGLLENSLAPALIRQDLWPDSGWVRPDVMRIFSASAKACRPWLFSMPHRGGEREAIRQQNHKKRHSGCLSIQKTVKILHNSHIVQAWDKNFFAKQKKRVSVVRDIRKPCVIHRLTHGNAALRSRIFMPNRYHAYGIQPLSQHPRSKAGGI